MQTNQDEAARTRRTHATRRAPSIRQSQEREQASERGHASEREQASEKASKRAAHTSSKRRVLRAHRRTVFAQTPCAGHVQEREMMVNP
eukprot:6202892-Pleurochrysis_carterae.AAC.3